jgi:hypothetical protein
MKHLQMGAMGLAAMGLLDRRADNYTIDMTPRFGFNDLDFPVYVNRGHVSRPTLKVKNEKRAARNKVARKSRKLNRR